MTDISEESIQAKKSQVQDYFSRTAESYVSSFSHKTGSDLQRLLEIGEWSSRQVTLDVATGGGHTALAIAPLVAEVVVSDLTPRMLEKAREYLLAQGVTNATFAIADAEHLPFTNTSFDRVTCRIAAHHFPDRGQAVKEVGRVLKTGGLFLLIDCMAPSDPELDIFDNRIEKWRDASHGRSCTKEEWQAFFTEAGLRVEHLEFFRKPHAYDDWTLRSQLPEDEKASLEQFILASDPQIQRYFEVVCKVDGHLERFSNDFILLKGRKE